MGSWNRHRMAKIEQRLKEKGDNRGYKVKKKGRGSHLPSTKKKYVGTPDVLLVTAPRRASRLTADLRALSVLTPVRVQSAGCFVNGRCGYFDRTTTW